MLELFSVSHESV